MQNEVIKRASGYKHRVVPLITDRAGRQFARIAMVLLAWCAPAMAQSFQVTNIISDGSVPASVTDPSFINPWGISASPTWWISTQGGGYNDVISAAGSPLGTSSFKVSIAPASGLTTATGLPAGSVTTGGATGMILPNGAKASFLFSTLDGSIAGWNSKLGSNGAIATIVINNAAAGASYPGLAILNTPANSYVLAPNFGTANKIEVYDSTFAPTQLTGTFTDPTLPAGYGPFSIHVLGTQVFVNYALRTTSAPFLQVPGAGNGIVSVFDVNGNFVARVATGGNLNAPWGIAYAPANFGIFSNDLLVGNFGDGKINVFDPKSYAYLGQLLDSTGASLAYPSLWELLSGGTAVTGTTSVSGGSTSDVYFSAGLASEKHGLFANIANGSVANAAPTFGFTASTSAATIQHGTGAQATLSIAPVNGFTGTVNLACSGLPVGATCVFSPSQMAVSPTAVSTGTVLIQTTLSVASLEPGPQDGDRLATLAFALPFASLLLLRRRKLGRACVSLRLMGVALISVVILGGLAGCGGANNIVGTPPGTSSVVITATSGTISQTTSVALTVQ